MVRTLEQITADKRYVHTKLRQFELDQVERPFPETVRTQGVGRAVRGMLQRAALKAIGQYDTYTTRVHGEIDAERQLVRDIEDATGHETAARKLFHAIRDTPEDQLPTYRATRRAFRTLSRELDKEEFAQTPSGIGKAWRELVSWVTYEDRELKWGAGIAAAALATVIVMPTHAYNEWKDKHRTFFYAQYPDTQLHPMAQSAIDAWNFTSYLHESWNRVADSESARWLVDEYKSFIDENAYNERFMHNDAGSDWTRPYAKKLRDTVARANAHLAPGQGPAQQIDTGGDTVDASWTHSSHNHTVSYPCGTAKQPRTCTRCVSTTHTFRLDKGRMASGLASIESGRTAFPDFDAPFGVQEAMVTVPDVPKHIRVRGTEAIQAYLAERNAWARSPMLVDYEAVRSAAHALRTSGLPDQMRNALPSYDPHFTTTTPFCGPPLSYPAGWQDHERMAQMTEAVADPWTAMNESIGVFAKAEQRLRTNIDILDTHAGDAQARKAMREIGDLGWIVSNANDTGSWHPTHAQRVLMEIGGFLFLAGAAGFGGYALLDKHRHTRLVRKLWENGYTEQGRYRRISDIRMRY